MLGSVQVFLTVLMPMYLLDAILLGEFAEIVRVTVMFTVPFLLIRFVSIAFSAYDRVASEKIYVLIVNEFLQKTTELDLGYFDDTKSYDEYNRAFGNCCSVIDSINGIVAGLVSSVFNIVLISGVLLWMDIYIFVAILVVISINFAINNKLKKIDYQYSRLFVEKNKQVNYVYRLFYIPQLVREIKAANLSDFILKLKQNFNDEIIRLTKEQVRKRSFFTVILDSMGILESGFIALYFAFAVVLGRITISEYFTCINAYNQLKGTIVNLTSIYTSLYSNSMFAEDYINFINSTQTETTNKGELSLHDIEKIEFASVTFAYPNNNNFSLDNVSFTIEKGDKVAIIGQNGAGKTTIIKLLLRLYDPTEGDILINDKNIQEYNTQSLRNAMQTLFQDFAIFAFTIRDNISLGREISEERIQAALHSVDLREKVDNLNLALETPITSQLYDEGIELSGGESQKMAISRIYASTVNTIIMDEPTSNLDPRAEYALYDRLMNETPTNSIVIVISHRLTLTYKMSKIIVVNNGKIAEQGTHEELMQNAKIYAEMYNLQAEKYLQTGKSPHLGI